MITVWARCVLSAVAFSTAGARPAAALSAVRGQEEPLPEISAAGQIDGH